MSRTRSSQAPPTSFFSRLNAPEQMISFCVSTMKEILPFFSFLAADSSSLDAPKKKLVGNQSRCGMMTILYAVIEFRSEAAGRCLKILSEVAPLKSCHTAARNYKTRSDKQLQVV